jgi:hypothetical protein
MKPTRRARSLVALSIVICASAIVETSHSTGATSARLLDGISPSPAVASAAPQTSACPDAGPPPKPSPTTASKVILFVGAAVIVSVVSFAIGPILLPVEIVYWIYTMASPCTQLYIPIIGKYILLWNAM